MTTIPKRTLVTTATTRTRVLRIRSCTMPATRKSNKNSRISKTVTVRRKMKIWTTTKKTVPSNLARKDPAKRTVLSRWTDDSSNDRSEQFSKTTTGARLTLAAVPPSPTTSQSN